METKITAKKSVKIQHLVNWYFGNFCAKCSKIDSKDEDCGKKCYNKLVEIKNNISSDEITHKEFVNIIRRTSFCHPSTRHFDECEVCKKFGINHNYWIRDWEGWNLVSEK